MTQRKWLKTTTCIDFRTESAVAWIALNRPDKRNALSNVMLEELRSALLEADDRLDVNAVVIEGRGKDFCAGYDLDGAYAGNVEGDSSGFDPALYRSWARSKSIDDDIWERSRQQEFVLPIFDLHKPVIAKVHGNCLAGGMDIAFACDIVLAAEDARIGFPAARANGTPPINFWMYHCGPQWAKRLLFTGDRISGRDAARIGLVMDAVPAEQLDEEVLQLVRRISAVDAELLAAHKRVVNLAMELAGAKSLQTFAGELDARVHLSQGPRRSQFKADMAQHGLKTALANRDAPFGDGWAKPKVWDR